MHSIPKVQDTPRQVPWSAVGEFERLDERVGAMTVIFGSVIGVNDGSVDWCPDDLPPSEQERLAWIWLCNPALDIDMLPHLEGWVRELVVAYRAGEMEQWWKDAASPPNPAEETPEEPEQC